MNITLEQIHKTIYELVHEGYNINAIEAFLINTDDFLNLCEISAANGTRLLNSDNEVYIHGVKIIENHHIPKGTIFKIFKDDALPENVSDFLPLNSMIQSFAISGIVSNGMGDDNPPIQNDVHIPDPAPSKSVEEVKQRHSTTRKIELD